jgi:hypothetical protein
MRLVDGVIITLLVGVIGLVAWALYEVDQLQVMVGAL